MISNIPDRLKSIVGSRDDAVIAQSKNEYVFSPNSSVIRPIITAVLLVIGASAAFIWFNQPHQVSAPVVVATGTPLGLTSVTPSPTMIVVDVEGKVRRPGLHTLPPDARVADAIAAAGGLQRSVTHTYVNLAARVMDGQLLVIGIPNASGVLQQGSASPDGGKSTTSQRININTATQSDFESLPGVGPVLAARLVQWRQEHGQFRSLDQMQDVPGIGPKLFERLSQHITTS